MATTVAKKPNTLAKRVESLERDMRTLRTFLTASAARVDPEGEYRPEFVKAVLAASKEKPIYRFKDAKSFLKQIRSV